MARKKGACLDGQKHTCFRLRREMPMFEEINFTKKSYTPSLEIPPRSKFFFCENSEGGKCSMEPFFPLTDRVTLHSSSPVLPPMPIIPHPFFPAPAKNCAQKMETLFGTNPHPPFSSSLSQVHWGRIHIAAKTRGGGSDRQFHLKMSADFFVFSIPGSKKNFLCLSESSSSDFGKQRTFFRRNSFVPANTPGLASCHFFE